MDDGLAEMLRARLSQALCSPWASEVVTGACIALPPLVFFLRLTSSARHLLASSSPHTISSRVCLINADWSGLSLGTATEASPPPTNVPQPGQPPGVLPQGMNNLMPPAQASSTPNSFIPEGAGLEQWTAEEVNTLNGLQGQFANLRVRKLIDEGASSQVWEGEWAGARVVIKVLREQEALRSFLSEVNIWRQLRHPCVCALLGVCMFDSHPSMVLEYMTGGSLHDLLHNSREPGDIDTALLTRIVAEVRTYHHLISRHASASASRFSRPTHPFSSTRSPPASPICTRTA